MPVVCSLEVRDGFRGAGPGAATLDALAVLAGQPLRASGNFTPAGFAVFAHRVPLIDPGSQPRVAFDDMGFVGDWDTRRLLRLADRPLGVGIPSVSASSRLWRRARRVGEPLGALGSEATGRGQAPTSTRRPAAWGTALPGSGRARQRARSAVTSTVCACSHPVAGR